MKAIERRGDLDRLLERCRGGERDAWAELVSRFEALVYSIPRRLGLGEDDAGDVFQATFVALYGHLDRIGFGAALPRWLSTTAARESYRLLRLRRPQDPDLGDLEHLLADEEAGAEQIATQTEEAERVHAGVDRLPSRCRDLLRALFFAGEDPAYDEIAEKLGMPRGAIGPTRARCLEKLRKILDAEGFFTDERI